MAVDPQQAALATAIAQHGSAGIQQAAAQQQTGAAGKQDAINAGASRAGLINAPADFLKQSATQIAQPYNNAAKSAANTSNAINSYTSALQGSNNDYMKQLSAAVPLAQAEVDKAASGQNLSQMIQLLNLKQSQEQYGLQNDAAKQAKTLEDNQKTVMNKILTHPDQGVQKGALAVISSNTSGTLPEALAALQSDDGKKQLKKLGLKDDSALRQILTEYYSDPTSYSALQSTQAAAQQAAAAATPPAAAKGGSSGGGAGFLKTLSQSLKSPYKF